MQVIVSMLCVYSQAAIAFASPPATTQPSRGGRSQPVAAMQHYEPVVLKLANANCGEVASMLSATFSGCTSYPVEQSNCIVFSGPPETQAMARRLAAEMDGMTAQRDGPRVAIAGIQHRRVDELVEQLARVASGPRLRFSGDRGRSKVLLRGDPEEIRQAEALLRELDTPVSGVSIEFAFLQAKAGGPASGPPMPSDLADVAKELERFGSLTLLGRLSTVAVEGDKFEVEGQVVPGIMAEVKGMVGSGGGDDVVKIEIGASLQLKPPPPSVAESKGGVSPPLPYFNIKTSVTTRHGEYLVLGSAPTGSAIGESAILVMHVRK